MTDFNKNVHAYVTANDGFYQSQHGEDKWLDEYFHKKHGGFYVEVGAYDGLVLSNTYFFDAGRGWNGILVEPDPDKAALCRKNRANAHVYECAAQSSEKIEEITFFAVSGGEVYSTINLNDSHRDRLNDYGLEYQDITVKAMTLNRILSEVSPRSIDFISIDVEEGEIEVLNGFDIRNWKPKIVIVESNGAERKAEIREYFVRNGYAYFHTIEINDFYRPVLGGRLSAWIIDDIHYNAEEYKKSIRLFLDRHILWRFNRK